jgi:radical SAM protein with 4Fe4S-binding SPASM domain
VESLKPDLFESAVTQFSDMGGTSLDFNVTIGDPLLDKRLLQRARFAKSKNITGLGFVTTLQWLHIHSIKEVVELFDWISVSTTLSGRDMYRSFFRVDLYDRMLTNLKLLIQAKKEWNPEFNLHIAIKPTDEPVGAVVNHPDFMEINRLHSQDLKKILSSRSIYVDDWSGNVKLPSFLKKRPLIPRFRRPCRFLYETLHVHSNGKVAGCACRDFNADSQLILGELSKNTLKEIWNGVVLNKIRSEWRSRNCVPRICKTCRFYQF